MKNLVLSVLVLAAGCCLADRTATQDWTLGKITAASNNIETAYTADIYAASNNLDSVIRVSIVSATNSVVNWSTGQFVDWGNYESDGVRYIPYIRDGWRQGLYVNDALHSGSGAILKAAGDAVVDFPSRNGTMALVSDIPTTMAWGSITGKPSLIEAKGTTNSVDAILSAASSYVDAASNNLDSVIRVASVSSTNYTDAVAGGKLSMTNGYTSIYWKDEDNDNLYVDATIRINNWGGNALIRDWQDNQVISLKSGYGSFQFFGESQYLMDGNGGAKTYSDIISKASSDCDSKISAATEDIDQTRITDSLNTIYADGTWKSGGTGRGKWIVSCNMVNDNTTFVTNDMELVWHNEPGVGNIWGVFDKIWVYPSPSPNFMPHFGGNPIGDNLFEINEGKLTNYEFYHTRWSGTLTYRYVYDDDDVNTVAKTADIYKTDSTAWDNDADPDSILGRIKALEDANSYLEYSLGR